MAWPKVETAQSYWQITRQEERCNVIPEWYRDKIQQKYGMPIEAWEAKTGKKLEDDLYRGTIRRGGHATVCGCAVGEEEGPHLQPITGT